MADDVLPPLVTVADLVAFNVDVEDEELAKQVAKSVSAGIRAAAGVPISRTTSTVELYGVRTAFLPLPGGPVVSVEKVLVNAQPIEDFKIRDGMLWRRYGWGDIEDDVTVTFSHGWDPVPPDVVKLGVNLVAAGLNEATSEGGLASRRGLVSRQESIDDYSLQESYVRGEDEVIDLTEIPDRTREWLRNRFGNQAYVTGSY
ncbi:hypothetical protein ACFP47_09250 [Nesterenkonia lacusekhoensis]|uniref:Head-to-tail adaptor n=1 Tax=Nesterenkonia lacusekhoensis TaxID=150832 RepID=A0ABS4SYX1_9MICC|nr:hypothetical protein [Nesterenkonia lacusekhoensis]MBP2317397.1 hypothetical protein [Nesterenkonia lacusekhoensis]